MCTSHVAKDQRASESPLAPFGEIVGATLRRTVPAHIDAVAYVGILALLLFAFQVVTGLLLMVYYRPSVQAAHYSIGVLSDEVRLGRLVRALHFWSAELLILFGLLHMVGIYFTRRYRPPWSISWMVRILLLVVLLALGFTGTLLPWDQYAYWEVDAARETIGNVPLVGPLFLNLLWGGWELGEEVLLRFYALHVGILPVIALALLSVHLLVVGYGALSAPSASAERARASRPLGDLLLELAIVGLLAFGALLSLAVVFPPVLLEPADPLAPLAHVQPRWYFLPARRLLRSLPPGTGALVLITLFCALLAVPLLDRRAIEPRWGTVVRWGLGLAVVGVWICLALQQYRS